jgi:DNA-binding LytR/AlgR family response regulator
MALFYAAFEKIFLKDDRPFEELVKTSAQQTALVLLLPYSASWLYFSWQDKKQQLASLEGLKGYQGSPHDMIAFYDDKSVLKFSVKKEYLLYIESAENYISIGYLDKGKLARYMLRDTLKNVEGMFSGTEIIRCHRSYMVNFEKVKVIRKGKDGLKLELEAPLTIDIPVSKTYVDSVMNTFARYSRAAETV